jgi:hypothetical protein
VNRDPIEEAGGLNPYGWLRNKGGDNAWIDLLGQKPIRIYPDRESAPDGGLFPNPDFEYPGGPPAMSEGGEALFGRWGVGYSTVYCCDEKMNLRKMRFFKVCFGYGVGVSRGYARISGMSGKDCAPEKYKGWFIEGGGVVAAVEGEIHIGQEDRWGILPGPPSGVIEGGGGVAYPIFGLKFMLCRYWLVSDETIACGCNTSFGGEIPSRAMPWFPERMEPLPFSWDAGK